MQSLKLSHKDEVIFVTKADHSTPSKYDLPPPIPNEKPRSAILPDGKINWACPCLGKLPYGPCGFEFREFFTCMHAAESDDDKRTQCFNQFTQMRKCFQQFPKLFPPEEDEPATEAEPNNESNEETTTTKSHN